MVNVLTVDSQTKKSKVLIVSSGYVFIEKQPLLGEVAFLINNEA